MGAFTKGWLEALHQEFPGPLSVSKAHQHWVASLENGASSPPIKATAEKSPDGWFLCEHGSALGDWEDRGKDVRGPEAVSTCARILAPAPAAIDPGTLGAVTRHLGALKPADLARFLSSLAGLRDAVFPEMPTGMSTGIDMSAEAGSRLGPCRFALVVRIRRVTGPWEKGWEGTIPTGRFMPRSVDLSPGIYRVELVPPSGIVTIEHVDLSDGGRKTLRFKRDEKPNWPYRCVVRSRSPCSAAVG